MIPHSKDPRELSHCSLPDHPILILDVGRRHLWNIISKTPPSKTTPDEAKDLHQDVLMGRPAGQYGFPVALYNTHLANFAHKLSQLDDDQVETTFPKAGDFFEVARDFFDASIKHYSTEQERQTACKPFLEKIGGDLTCSEQVTIERVAKNKATETSERSESDDRKSSQSSVHVDLAILTRLSSDTKVLPVMCEVTREDGEGDTCVQGVKYFAEMVYGFGEKVCD